MDLLTISLLLFSAVLHVHPSTTHKPKHWQYNTRKVNNLPDDNKHCFCYPSGQLPTVQQLLDSQNNGQERLVIYLYKNGDTNEIKMYTPNANKQVLIPDIPYEAGDGLVTVTGENLYTLLYNNPYKIKVYNDHVETLVPTVTDSMAIGLNTGAIEHIYPNGENYLEPNNNYKGNEYSLAENIIIANGPSGDVFNEPQKGSTYIPANDFPEPYDNSNLTPEQYWMNNNYPYIKPDDTQAIPLNTQVTLGNPQAIPLNPQGTPGNPQAIPLNPQGTPGNPQAIPLNPQVTPGNPQAIPLNPQGTPGNPQAIPLNPQVTPGNPQAIPLNPQGTPGNPQAIPLNPQVTPGNPQAIPLNPIVTPGNPQAIPLNPQVTPGNPQAIPLNPQATENSLVLPLNPQSSPYKLQLTPINAQSILPNPQGVPDNYQDYLINPQAIPGYPQAFPESYVGGLDQHVVYTFQADQRSNKLQLGSQDNNNPLSAQYMTFNIWFNQQMKRFQNIHLPNDLKTIDSNVLRILVQKTFYENNIYISGDGVITDAKGIVIDAANLELRPLLLGETLNHQILQNAHKLIKLPKHLPYLEGILVTLVSPPQILGIIPLGKTFLPVTSYMAQSLGGLTTVNGSKIYLDNYGNAVSTSSPAKIPYTLAYKQIYAGPTNYYAYSGVNGVPISGNSNSVTYSKALPLAYPYTIGNKEPELGERNYWSSGPYQTVSNLPFPTANWNLSELKQLLGQRRKISDAKIEHHIEPPRNSKKGKGRRKSTGKGDVSSEVTTAEPFPNFNSSESGRRFPAPTLTGVMKTLLYLLNDLPSRRGLNSTEEVDVVKESESNNDEGGPDFRIIGGNAATGSGTPLSNKGRSGSTEYA